MTKFCEEYAKIIEYQVESSNGFKCPKIRANYDDYEEYSEPEEEDEEYVEDW